MTFPKHKNIIINFLIFLTNRHVAARVSEEPAHEAETDGVPDVQRRLQVHRVRAPQPKNLRLPGAAKVPRRKAQGRAVQNVPNAAPFEDELRFGRGGGKQRPQPVESRGLHQQERRSGRCRGGR